jgi:hypothetical protein
VLGVLRSVVDQASLDKFRSVGFDEGRRIICLTLGFLFDDRMVGYGCYARKNRKKKVLGLIPHVSAPVRVVGDTELELMGWFPFISDVGLVTAFNEVVKANEGRGVPTGAK